MLGIIHVGIVRVGVLEPGLGYFEYFVSFLTRKTLRTISEKKYSGTQLSIIYHSG